MKKVLFLVVALFVFSSCDDSGETSNNNNNNGNNGSVKDLCGGMCEDGQYCWNGICVNGCLSNNDCAADQYCVEDDFFDEGHCENKDVPACNSNSDCASTQECKLGACTAKPAEAQGCEWKADMTDGCVASEVCIQEDEGKGTCYQMPACGQNQECPKDIAGAVCNEKGDGTKIIPSKGRICLMGACMGNDDCPSTMECSLFAGDLGGCMPKGMDMGDCETDDDCEEGETCEGEEMGMGMCIPGF